VIKKAIEKLGMRHREHIAAYGEGNERRLTGPPTSILSPGYVSATRYRISKL
jgi:hypothetical protein